MKIVKTILFILLMIISTTSFSQRWKLSRSEYSFGLGMSNYVGDIGGAIEAGSSEEIIVVTNPELPAITDAAKTVKLCEEIGKPVIGIVLTRTKSKNLDVSVNNIETIIEKPIIGIIPEDKYIRHSLIRKDAIVYTYPNSKAAIGYKRLAANILGQNYEPETIRKENWLFKMLKKLGI